MSKMPASILAKSSEGLFVLHCTSIMSETPPVPPLVFQGLKTDNFGVCRLGNNVEISAKLLADEIPNLVYVIQRLRFE
jgi:hypothetical protein